LDTTDLDIAKKLASYVRGRTGGFTNIQGVIGLPQTHRRTGKACTIVSCEVSNPTKTPLHRIYNLLKAEAARYGVNVIAGQVCGTIAAEVLVQTAEWYLQLEGSMALGTTRARSSKITFWNSRHNLTRHRFVN